MRPLKFRAWYPDRKVMTAGYDLICLLKKAHEHSDRDFQDSIDGIVVMQFTGLHDKNGKEIFEGDVVIIPNDHHADVYAIEWFDGGYWQGRDIHLEETYLYGEDFDHIKKGDVRGNIHEHPEILK